MKIISNKGNNYTVQVKHEGEILNLNFFRLGTGIIPDFPRSEITNDWKRIGIITDARRLIKGIYG